MRPLDHCDLPAPPHPFADCYGCDRCEALELAPHEFFVCPCCREVLCDVHAEPIYDAGLRTAICGECYETGGPGAGR